jgi:hypothetical protein
MRIWKKTCRGVVLAVTGAVLMLTPHPSASAETASPRSSRAPHDESSARIRVPNMATEWPLRLAINGAHQWLADGACQAVLSDFRDQSGRPLSDVLAERHLTPQEYLGYLAFWDGSHLRQCHVPGVAFATAPGYAIVYVCQAAFRRLHPRKAQATVIHEMLHTLGLGENPPASREITARVLERCEH